MTYRARESNRGATRLGFADLIVVAIMMALLLFASWKQFPAYNRPFKPRPKPTHAPRPTAPNGIRTPAHKAARSRSETLVTTARPGAASLASNQKVSPMH
ncbi:MAG TPA: hypothetical protein VNF49_12490 [Candidatus Binataceae bacterium]|nr:hypothetical protein [Candidatus Binataceae bacterium]